MPIQPKHEKTLEPLKRVLHTLVLLCGDDRGRTLQELADTVGISKRTMRRYLVVLQQVGVDLRRTGEDGAECLWYAPYVELRWKGVGERRKELLHFPEM